MGVPLVLYVLPAALVVLLSAAVWSTGRFTFVDRAWSFLPPLMVLPLVPGPGFPVDGLFAYSRHPAYACEIALWGVFYLLGAPSAGVWLHWTLVGWIVFCLQSPDTIRLTEALSCRR